MHELIGLHGHPVFLRRDALAAGYDDNDLRAALGRGELMRVRHGAYTSPTIWAAADDAGRHQLRCFAVLEVHGPGVAVSHTSAVVMHGLPVWGANLERVHLTRLDATATRRCRDVVYHRGRLPRDQVTKVGRGHLATMLDRAVVEHAMVVSIESGLTTLDAYLNQRPPAGLQPIREQLAGWPGAQRIRITLGLARTGAESVGESRFRFLCFEKHIPEPQLQVPVYDEDGHLIGITDFGWPNRGVLGEFDGKSKYTQHLRPGESASDAVFREKRREDRIREVTGCSVIRFTWADLHERDRTAARLRRALRLP